MNNSSNPAIHSPGYEIEDDFNSIMNNTFWSPLWIRDDSKRLDRRNYPTEFYYSFCKNRRIKKPTNSDDDLSNYEEDDSSNNEEDIEAVRLENDSQCPNISDIRFHDFLLNHSSSKNIFSSQNHKIKNSTMNSGMANRVNLEEQTEDLFNVTMNASMDNPVHVEAQTDDLFNSTMYTSSNQDICSTEDFHSIMNNVFWSPLWKRDESRRLQRMNYPTQFYYSLLIKRKFTRNFKLHNTTNNDSNNSSNSEDNDVDRFEYSSEF